MATNKKDVDFEKQMNRLEEITILMQKNELSLDKSLVLYEEAQKLIKEMNEELKNIKIKVEKYKNS